MCGKHPKKEERRLAGQSVVNLHENAREAVAPDTARASRSSRIKVDAGIAGIEMGAGIEIISRIDAEENAATATNDNGGAIPAEVRKYLQAVLHDTPSFTAKPDGSGIGPNVVHPHHAPLRRIAASDGNTGSRAASRPYSERYPCKTTGKAVKKASEAHPHTPLIGASGRRASVRRGTHRGTDSSSTPDRSKG